MAVTARGIVRRLEVWTDWAADGGTIDASIGTSIPDFIDCKAQIGLDQARLSVSFLTTAQAAPYATGRKILRLIQNDTVFDEWKIVSRTTDKVNGVISLDCATIRETDLSEGALIHRLDSDGTKVYDFESVGLTRTEHINAWILPALAAAGFGWFGIGTITPTDRVDMVYSWDTPLSALLRLADGAWELDVRRNGITGYLIDIV